LLRCASSTRGGTTVGAQTPNTSVEPTAYAVSIRIVMDSLFTLMSFHSPASRLWLTSIR
jgi:hypothetical protein